MTRWNKRCGTNSQKEPSKDQNIYKVTQKDETELQTAQKDENKDHDDKKGLDMMDAQKDHEELQRDSQRL